MKIKEKIEKIFLALAAVPLELGVDYAVPLYGTSVTPKEIIWRNILTILGF